MSTRCIRCGREFETEAVNHNVCCPYCGYVRKLTKVMCMQCQQIFGVVDKCHAVCPGCGYQHSCSEAEVIEQ